MDSRLAHSDHRQDLDDVLGRALLAQLTASGLPRTPANAAEIKEALKLRDSYERWLEESLQVLTDRGHLECADGRYSAKGALPDTDAAWREWSRRKQDNQRIPGLAVQTALVDKTLRALPDILTGNVRATDIMFPNASMSLVEGIYKNNPIADFFNDTIAELAVAYIEERIRQDPDAQIKILEVGAGTGGTTARVLPRLDAHRDHIAEYCYTDLSRAFLAHGEDSYGTDRPYLRFHIFDVEKPIAGQGVQAGTYDLVIATNVLHATKVIRRTLRNVKAALRRNGLLLLNELCDKNLPDHLTFGLLEGWWLHEDSALRMPGSPALLPETWQRVLEAEGFRSVFFPARSARPLGLQVIVAESDGVVRQEKAQTDDRPAAAKPQKKRVTPGAKQQKAPAPDDAAGNLTANLLRALADDVARLLKLKPDDIAFDTDLNEYGFDSISFNQLVNQLNQSYQLELAPTVFFEHPTLEDFARYLLSEHGTHLADRFAPQTPAADTLNGKTATSASPPKARVSQRPAPKVNARPQSVEADVREPERQPPVARAQSLLPSEAATEPATRHAHPTQHAASPAPTTSAGPFPLSHGQEQLWFLEQLEDLGSAYHVPVVLRLSGSLNIATLEKSLETIVQRHQILRACFSAQDGAPVQSILPMGDFGLPIENFEGFAEADRDAAARARQQEIIQKPFDLSSGGLFRAVLLRLTATEHLLVVVMHHIVTDGWSLGVLLNELDELYSAFSLGHAHALPDLPLQYTDFVSWQRERAKSDAVRSQLDYWREALRDMPDDLALSTDRPRPAKRTFRGAALPIMLPKPLTHSLRALARSEGVTLYMVLLGAFQLLVSRLSGQTDVAVGTPSAGRGRHELESLIGFFSNTLVLRTDISGDPNFRELLKRVKKTALGAYAHQDLPFGRIVEALNPARHLSRPVFFQAMLQLMRDQLSTDRIKLGELTTELVPAETGASQFDLTITLVDGQSQISGTVEYAVDLFDKATMQRLVEQFIALLEQISEAPDRPGSELSLLTRSERQQLLQERNGTAHDYPRRLCTHQMFEAQAAKTPDAVALVSGTHQLTYAELDRAANQVAHHLKANGVGPESIVGLFVAQSPEMIIGLLGILKAGGAYLPLDPHYPSERLAYMLNDARAATLVTTTDLAPQLPKHDARAVRLDADAGEIAGRPTTAPACDALPENVAYVIYTSGSTGKPKGVAMPHRALVNLVNWHIANATDPRSTRILQLTPISFDVSFQEIFTTLAGGRCLLLDNGELRLDRGQLLNFIKDQEVDEVFAPQVLLEQVAEEADARDVTDLPLKAFYQAGEALRVSPAIARLFGRRSHARLHNHYGPSEAHVVSSFTLPSELEESAGAAPIGWPIWNTQLYVLDDRLSPVPSGNAGELYIGGDCLARGYLDRPGLTAERFVPNPFADGERLYRTGDRARYLPDRNLEFLGRADDQVKIRGFRVELGEIEAALRACAGVGHVAVVAKGEAPSSKKLVAYIIPDGPSFDANTIRTELREILPEYMVPSTFVPLDAFPLTPSGKIDRKSLPEPQAESSTRQVILPRHGTRYENEIAQIWKEVLQLPTVSIDDNFFELGGHSLLLMRVHSKLVSMLGKSLPVTALFQYPTVRKLAAHIAQTYDDTSTLRGAQARGALRKKLIQSQ